MRDQMQKKFDNLDELNLTSNLLIIQQLAYNWSKLKPKNESVNKLKDAIIEVSLLSNKLQLDRNNYNISIDQYRTTSLRMIERARKAEAKILELEKDIERIKKQKELGL